MPGGKQRPVPLFPEHPRPAMLPQACLECPYLTSPRAMSRACACATRTRLSSMRTVVQLACKVAQVWHSQSGMEGMHG